MAALNPRLLSRITKLHQRFGEVYNTAVEESQELSKTIINRQAGSSIYDPAKKLGFQIWDFLNRSPLILNFYAQRYPSAKFKAASSIGDDSVRMLNQQRYGVDVAPV